MRLVMEIAIWLLIKKRAPEGNNHVFFEKFIAEFGCIANGIRSKVLYFDKEISLFRMEIFTCCWKSLPSDFTEAHGT